VPGPAVSQRLCRSASCRPPRGVVYFFHDHRGKPVASQAPFEPVGEKFRRDLRGWAQASGIPVIVFKARERKAEVMAPYLQAAGAAGASWVDGSQVGDLVAGQRDHPRCIPQLSPANGSPQNPP
jgi:hypothetical protein